jgi:hypothetical protein
MVKLKELRKKRKRKVDETFEKLLGDSSIEEINAGIAWLEASSKLLNIYRGRKPWYKLTLAFIIVLFTALVFGIITKSEVNASMKVRCTNVNFLLSEKWPLPDPIPVDYLRIENFQALHAPELDISFNDESRGSYLELRGENIVIENLELQPGGTIEMDSMESGDNFNCIRISLKQTKLKGSFSVKKISTMTTRGGADSKIEEKIFEYPECIEFSAEGQGIVPTTIILKIREDKNKKVWHFRDINTKKLKFLKDIPSRDGTYSFVSSITGGEFQIYDVPIKKEVQPRDTVTMEKVALKRLGVSIKKEITISFEGKVKNLKVGPKGFEKKMSPSLLEYLYHQEHLEILYVFIVGLWGLVFGILRIFFKW